MAANILTTLYCLEINKILKIKGFEYRATHNYKLTKFFPLQKCDFSKISLSQNIASQIGETKKFIERTL